MFKKRRITRFSIYTFLLLGLNVAFSPVFLIKMCYADEECSCNKGFIKGIPQKKQQIMDTLKNNPDSYWSEYFIRLNREIISCSNKDPKCLDNLIKYYKILEFYDEVAQKSNDIGTTMSAIRGAVTLWDKRNMKEEALPIVKRSLTHNNVDIRINVADILFKKGYKEEAYTVYVDIITKNPEELKNMLENRTLSYGFVMELESEKAKSDSEYKKDLDKRIANWKTAPIINILQHLVEYDDLKTKELFKKAVNESSYIASVFSEYKVKNLIHKHDIEKRLKFLEKAELYLK